MTVCKMWFFKSYIVKLFSQSGSLDHAFSGVPVYKLINLETGFPRF